ncbi:MAG: indolepyruvate oxidoreductase subunit beta [Bacteroidales bacterium]|nr:indolepyruvate oxidoreductase subunit beta [Bacteroidales bacterium]
MKRDIIIAGVGGQGILSISAIISIAAMEKGWHVKQSEVHGMAQRGGEVQSHLRLSEKPIFSSLIPEGTADMILSVEPLESLRYVNFLHADGWLITNSKPYVNIPNYPPIEEVYAEIKKFKKHILLDADAMAKEINNPKGMNMIMLGAASTLLPLERELYLRAIRQIFERKGEDIIALNVRAFEMGEEFARNYIK